MTIRTGSDYINGLKGHREVWIKGDLVTDVVNNSFLVESIKSIAMLYDLQNQSDLRETLTYKTENGDIAGTSFLPPVNNSDIAKRHAAIKIFADATFGMMGRSPDFLNSVLMAFASAKGYFSQAKPVYGNNIENYYQYCRTNDLFLAHATINPQIDRTKSPHEQQDEFTYLRVVREVESGCIVRGAKMISTLAPIADELLVFPLPGYRQGDEPYTIAFGIPISSPGLRLICREPIRNEPTSYFDHPLGSRFDEMDAFCVFDDVLIPWERIFFLGSVELANSLYNDTFGRHFAGHQGMIRGLAKAELAIATAIKLASSSKIDNFLHVQEMLGEILGYFEIIKGTVLLSEADAKHSKWGVLSPAIEPIQAFRYHFPKMYARMIEIIGLLGAGSLLSSPVEKDFHNQLSQDVNRYFRGADSSAYDRVKLLKLAWDLAGDGFGQRQVLYERYHAGDPVRIAASLFQSFDKDYFATLIDRALLSEKKK